MRQSCSIKRRMVEIFTENLLDVNLVQSIEIFKEKNVNKSLQLLYERVYISKMKSIEERTALENFLKRLKDSKLGDLKA